MFLIFFKALRTALKDRTFYYILIITLAHLALGTVVYSIVENWRTLDALYFCVISLTTIGFGDFHPKTDYGKIFTMFYSILGLGIISSLASGIFNAFKINLGNKRKDNKN